MRSLLEILFLPLQPPTLSLNTTTTPKPQLHCANPTWRGQTRTTTLGPSRSGHPCTHARFQGRAKMHRALFSTDSSVSGHTPHLSVIQNPAVFLMKHLATNVSLSVPMSYPHLLSFSWSFQTVKVMVLPPRVSAIPSQRFHHPLECVSLPPTAPLKQ